MGETFAISKLYEESLDINIKKVKEYIIHRKL